MNPLHCPLAATDFELIREYLRSLSLDELITVTEDIFSKLSASEQVTFSVNRYCSEYNDYGGRINFFKALFDNGIIFPIHIPYQYQRNAGLIDLIRPQIYEYYIPIAHDLSEEAAALTDDLEETTSDITVTNPRWVHVDEKKMSASPDIATVGDEVYLYVDVSGVPEGATVTFDVFDVSLDPPFRIGSASGKNEQGMARGKWSVEDPQKRGQKLKIEFEGIAKSKASSREPIDLKEKPKFIFSM